jgi:gliding motility-associated-like protein
MPVYSQFSVDPSNATPFTPNEIIENVFLGSGVEILNISYQGTPQAVGVFNNASPFIGLERGIVLSTGSVRDINQNAAEQADGNTSQDGVIDLQLEQLAGISVVDVAKFTIQFRPTSDTLRFRYVFASDEYPNLQCTSSNDAFGFFIQGTNPNGPDYNFTNIALIPDPNSPRDFLNLPVTINNINNGIVPSTGDPSRCDLGFSQYYNEVAPLDFPIFNGYLDVFTAEAIVVPCETYTIKIVIGDGRDNGIDSAVFLEAKSFSTGSLDINVDNPGLDGGISEGCTSGQINLSLPRSTAIDFPIEVEVLTDPSLPSMATLDSDFELLVDNLVIEAGESSTNIELIPLMDNEDEDTEFIYLAIRRDVCNVDTLVVPIFDNSLDFVEIPDTLYTCFQNPIEIESAVDSVVNITEPAFFTNGQDFRTLGLDSLLMSPIEVSNLPQEFLNPRMIAEICIDTLVHPRLNDLDIFLQSPSGQYLELSTDNGLRDNNESQIDSFVNTCFIINGFDIIHLGDPLEGALPLSNPTYTGVFLPEGDFGGWLSPIVSEANGTYNLAILDDQGEFTGELKSWSITFNATYEIEYEWFPSDGLNCTDCPTITALVDTSQYYFLRLTDSYNCASVDSVRIEVISEPIRPNTICEAISPSEVILRWDDVPNASLYEFRVNDRFPWLSTDIDTFAFGYGFTQISDNEVRIDGLGSEEEIEIIFRGVNVDSNVSLGACVGVNDTLICKSLPCDNSSPLITAINISQPSCDTQGGAPVEVIAVDGDLPITYRVFGDTFTEENGSGIFPSLPQGNSVLKVTDATGCVTTDTIRVVDPPPVQIIETISEITCTNANDGTISLQVNSENPPNRFEWAHDITADSLLTDLGEGIYSVTVTDNDGCTNTAIYQLINPEPIIYSFNQVDTIDCAGLRDGSANINIEGGRPPYTITRDGNEVNSFLTGLRPGTVNFQIEDSNGCIIQDTAIVVQDDGFELSGMATPLTCYTDSSSVGTVIASLGQAPYSYLWENGQTEAMADQLHAGDNFVTVTDQEGCIEILAVNVDSPPQILIRANVRPTSCFGGSDGSITLALEGGVGAPYDIMWFDGRSVNTQTNLSAGNYCVTVVDDNACEAVRCFNVPDAPVILANATVNDVVCENSCSGSIILNPVGGTGDFNYTWLGPSGFNSEDANITDLCIGEYQLTITEAADPNCSQSFVMNIEMVEAVEAAIVANKFISCHNGNDGIIEGTATAGVGPFSYQWSNNVQVANDSIASQLSQGLYGLTITDVNGCTAISQFILSEPDSIEASFDNTSIVCFGDSTGQSIIDVIGGMPDYLINWDTGVRSDTISNLTAGSYAVTIIDANGCELVDVTEILQPENDIEIDFNNTDISCSGGSDGIVRLAVSNAARPIQYSLDNVNFKFDSTFFNQSAGLMTAYVIDANGCEQTQEFMLNEGPELVVDLGDDFSVEFDGTAFFSATVDNNQGSINYEWLSASPDIVFSCQQCPNPTVENIQSAFSVELVVVDETGCRGSDFVNVFIEELNNVQVPRAFSPNSDGANDILNVFGDPGINISSFRVYNRYGSVVYSRGGFETNDESIGWNGTYRGSDAPVDTYTWTVEFVLGSGRVEFRSGQVTLIR